MQTGPVENKVVVFQVGKEEYAVTIAAVKEVQPWTQPTPVPEAPPMVEGVMNLRGDIIPVIDLGRLFRSTRLKAPEESKTIVMELDGQQAGFVVDDVTEVHTVTAGQVSPPSPVLRTQGGNAQMISGIIKMGENRLVVLVEPRRILANAQLSSSH
ncbi:MAG TPA: chemotaxis protein CheW [Symbiobacteriaceae bacterium]|nr:chemotaxis protein CheW [Symbiobacteriaceae bacterium]